MKRLLTACLLTAWIAVPAAADNKVTNLDDLLKSFGWPDLATAEIKTEKLREGIYVLFGVGGNIAVSIGENGTIIKVSQRR